MSDIKKRITAFISETFLFGDSDELGDDTSFLDEGIVDSTGVLELVDFIEASFGVTIADDELLPENLDSINKINEFVRRKRGSPSG
jgi:acyl carrier protein